jgi:hypothetical protein
LVKLLDTPDPAGPLPGADGTPVVREMLRVNHARNCQLCHAPSFSASDPVRRAVPSPDLPLPPTFAGGNYRGRSAAAKRSAPSPSGAYVRADVTYLRADFSLPLPVDYPGPWPKLQRYDFFVRTRPAQPWELQPAEPGRPCPQRAAVLRALRGLTGQDYGDRAADWRTGLQGDSRFKI